MLSKSSWRILKYSLVVQHLTGMRRCINLDKPTNVRFSSSPSREPRRNSCALRQRARLQVAQRCATEDAGVHEGAEPNLRNRFRQYKDTGLLPGRCYRYRGRFGRQARSILMLGHAIAFAVAECAARRKALSDEGSSFPNAAGSSSA